MYNGGSNDTEMANGKNQHYDLTSTGKQYGNNFQLVISNPS